MRARWICIILIILLPFAYAQVFESQGSVWLNRGESGSNKDISYTVYPQSGDDPERVTVKINSTRYIIRTGDCAIHLEQYQFCYSNSRFAPESDQGYVDYSRDTYYYQETLIVELEQKQHTA